MANHFRHFISLIAGVFFVFLAVGSDENRNSQVQTNVQTVTVYSGSSSKSKKSNKAAIEEYKDLQYVELMTKANNLFKEHKYEDAKGAYLAASNIKGEEIAPITQIDEIDKRLKEYHQNIETANNLLAQKNYTAAKISFEKALDIYEFDNTINLANKIKATEASSVADSLFANGKYIEAKSKYAEVAGIDNGNAQANEGLNKIKQKEESWWWFMWKWFH